jgi:predicted TIM-barrel fold metal-dependent hydrolase
MLYTLSGESPAPTDPEFYKAYIDRVFNAFGPNRVLYGSNWTLSDMHGSYENLVGIYDAYLEHKEILSPEKLYTTNTIKAFGLDITR